MTFSAEAFPQPPAYTESASESATPRVPRLTRRELVEAAIIVAVLAGLGVIAGVVWAHFAPGRPLAYMVTKTAIIPDETESFISTDGRFVFYTAVIGLVVGALAWTRRSVRGPLIALSLAGGGALGAYLTSQVGTALGGGKALGPINTVITTQLTLHATQLIAVEAFVALAPYCVAALFCDRTDLGRSPSEGGPSQDLLAVDPSWGLPQSGATAGGSAP